MNPAIIIPTYWSGRRSTRSYERNAVYDHMTPIDKPGNLAGLFDSLTRVDGVGRIIVLVAAEAGAETQAAEKVRNIANRYPSLDIALVSQPEVKHIHRRMEQIGLGALSSCACLNGYGAIHNLGILAASIFGNDVAIFLDDNVVIQGSDFIERALYGIGAKTPNGDVVAAKTGVLINEDNTALAQGDTPWYRSPWNRSKDFNEYIEPVMKGSRLSRANIANSSCLVLHAEAYGAVSFDPWITRGEDIDYVINSRMYGRDVWLDNKLTPLQGDADIQKTASNIEQDIYRWYYESRKIEFAKAQIDLMQVTPESMEPYPGGWLKKSISRKALLTCLLSAIGDPEHGAYFRLATKGRKEAAEYARENCARYFEFQRQWPTLVRGLWNCTPLATQLSGARAVSSGAGFTGRFSAVTI